ncbi:MAG: amidohydrolase family protein [Dehalococcoidia bacterium]
MADSTLKIDNAKFVLTLDPERRIVRDGSILIDGQRIKQVGKDADLEAVEADRVIDAREMVVTPGFCNGHIHISYAHATRGIFPDNLPPQEYLANVFKLQSVMTEEEEYYTSLLACTELLKYGTTCFLDPGSTKYLDACMQAYEESGCRIIVGAGVGDLPNPLNLPLIPPKEALKQAEVTIRTYNNRLDGRVRAWAMPFSSDQASQELLAESKKLADAYETGMTVHMANSPDSIEYHRQKHGKRPAKYLEEIGALGPNVLLSHAVDVNQSEVESIACTGTKVVMCPTAAMKMGAGTTGRGMLPEMLERSVCVGIGTDSGNNSNLVESMRSMYLVATLYKDARQTTDVMPAETALEMATIRGAKSLGLEDEIGSIEVGKKADLVLFDTKRPEWRTLFNPVNTLVYNADGRSVHTVIVDGKVVVENHEPTFVDEWELIQKVQAIGEDMLTRTGVPFPQHRWPVV